MRDDDDDDDDSRVKYHFPIAILVVDPAPILKLL